MTNSDILPKKETDLPPLFIYLHGFNSKGDPSTQKMKELSKLGETITVDYNSFSNYDTIEAHLSEQILQITLSRKNHFTILVGTSLGGYWAAVIGKKLDIPAVIINPAIQPQQTLKKYIGIKLENFKDGQPNTLSSDVPSSYPDAPKVGKYLILLDLGDDVLDPTKSKSWFTHNPVISFEGGSHPFDHMKEALPEISKFVSSVVKKD
ncbi:MAG: YqiA/YcfP family alpha/beta fold hydrolase [Balneolaceae bacterium]